MSEALFRHCKNESECKRIEALLREEVNLNTAILDATDALVVVLDPQGYIVRFNNAYAKITGYTFVELKNQRFWELFKQAHKQRVKANFHKLLSLESISYHSDLISKNGSCHSIAWSSIPFLDANGIKYIICTGTDITSLKRLEIGVLQEQAQQTELLVNLILPAQPVLDSFLGYVLRSLTHQLSVPSGGIWLYDEACHTTILHIDYEDGQIRQGEEILRPGASTTKPLKQWDIQYMPLLKQKQILIQDVQDLSHSPEYTITRSYNQQRGIRRIVVIPLLYDEVFLGNITLRSTQQHNYKSEELELARVFASKASLAIGLTRLTEQHKHSLPEHNQNTDSNYDLDRVNADIVQQKHTNRGYIESLAGQKLWQVIDYINNHLDQNLSLAELAALVQISPHYFSHWFKQSTGISPHQYVIKCRVERAKQLLLQGEHTITEIALCVGFANQGHLNRHFKRFFGVNPKQMRQK